MQFGPGEMQQHGFARNVEWEVGSTSADLQPDERDPCLELVLRPSEYSDKMFPYKFKLVYTITLHGTELRTDYRCAAPSLELACLCARCPDACEAVCTVATGRHTSSESRAMSASSPAP